MVLDIISSNVIYQQRFVDVALLLTEKILAFSIAMIKTNYDQKQLREERVPLGYGY